MSFAGFSDQACFPIVKEYTKIGAMKSGSIGEMGSYEGLMAEKRLVIFVAGKG